MGNAVNETNLTKELQRYRDAGLGGMHIIPLYGAKGAETNFVEYLSPRWMSLLRHTAAEAKRLGLGLDMTTGTGWNFGGLGVPLEESCLKIEIQVLKLVDGQPPPDRLDHRWLLAVLASPPEGHMMDLTDHLAGDGSLDWKTVPPNSEVRMVTLKAGYLPVERAAPGGEGHMINPFYGVALSNYLRGFSAAFAGYEGLRPRAMYHDSYEYHDAAWSPDLYEQFQRRRGYRLEEHRAALFRPNPDDGDRRVRGDFHETLSDLVRDSLVQPWTDWAHRHGFITRNQAHGSPGNLLDLYAAADIPETEIFSKDRDILISKFASSAAHVAGRPLVSSETGTWIAEHFTETLAELKRLVDELFLASVNHVFYHGTAYSPDEAGWPGWLFYAATQMNPRNAIWRDVPALNAYITRCQSVLQSGASDNDLLLYWPVHDLWHQQEALVEELTVHRRGWFDGQSLGPLARQLWKRGYTFDYVSDRMLRAAEAAAQGIKTGGGNYAGVVVPQCRMMPPDTLRKLLALTEGGATIFFQSGLPQDVPGWHEREQRLATLQSLLARLDFKATDHPGVRAARLGKGQVFVGEVEAALRLARVRREAMVDEPGMLFLRRKSANGPDYFVVNTTGRAFEGWLPLAAPAKSVALMDPMTGRVGLGFLRQAEEGTARVYVQLEPAQSVILRTFASRAAKGPNWAYLEPVGQPAELRGRWQVQFITGGPELPPPFAAGQLGSWTAAGGKAAESFAGTARYSLRFDAPTAAEHMLLDLGRVCESARVRLNGRDLGTLFLPPFCVVAEGLKPKDNLLEVEVTNLSANRIRDLDRRAVKWKNFYDINFVSITYQPFDASNWPLRDSGLLGPVTLQPLMALTASEMDGRLGPHRGTSK
jgi:hypothetical protein